MKRLRDAVAAGIITEAQREAIEALESREPGLKLSMVHLLWLGGTGLIVFAMVLLAAEISQGEMVRLIWVCLAYAAGLFALDIIVQRQQSLRLLSALLVLGIGASMSIAIGAFIDLQLGYRGIGRDWPGSQAVGPPVLNGIYLPSLPVLLASAILLHWRGFLPGWIGILSVPALWILDVYLGAGLSDQIGYPWLFLIFSVIAFGLAWFFDLRQGPNHGFWINKMGLLAFFFFVIAVTIDRPQDDYVLLLSTGFGLILFSLFLRRSAGVSGGALALAIYVADWVFEWDNLYVATGVIALVGLLAIYAGVRAHLIEDRLDAFLPESLKRRRPEAREDPITFGW
ncbi:MAG: hypothetical protein AAF922_07725 [Pseudomonadota bacterium]